MHLSKRNKRGLLWVLLISLCIAYTPRVLSLISSPNKAIITFEEAKSLESDLLLKQEYAKHKRFNKYKKRKKFYRIPDSKFDPNRYTAAQWEKLGLSPAQTAVILKFTSRGIYSNNDLKKIFVIPEELFEKIKDSTFYPTKPSFTKYDGIEVKQVKTIDLVDLNSADQEKMETIPGIGPYFAKNIIEYREKLGGFTDKTQLLEVWKFTPEKYDQVKEYVEVNGGTRKINVNTCELDVLKNHPYIRFNIANSIIKMRHQKGKFEKLEDLKESKLIDEEVFRKLKTYLTL